jgi:hypothetical protein
MAIPLSTLRTTVRRMTARYTAVQMQDSQIDTYLNNFMTLMLPEHFKNIKLTKPYVFTTVPNVDTYDFVYQDGLVVNPAGTSGEQNEFLPGNIVLTPPVYCQGYILRFYNDKTTFYNRWPNLSVNQIVGSGGQAVMSQYTGIIPSTPFYRAQLDVFGNVTEAMVIISAYDSTGDSTSGFTYVLTDSPNSGSDVGDLLEKDGTSVGTVNYITGVFQFTPSGVQVIPAVCNIYAAVVPYQASRPTDVIFYNQQITFRPCPQQVYQVEFQISQQPLALISDGDAPELDEWYLFICAGAAKLIYTDFPDEEGMAYVMQVFQEQLQLAQRRTLKQLGTQRAATIFSQPGRPLASWFFGTEYSGTSG